jgi:hypothetical protein
LAFTVAVMVIHNHQAALQIKVIIHIAIEEAVHNRVIAFIAAAARTVIKEADHILKVDLQIDFALVVHPFVPLVDILEEELIPVPSLVIIHIMA